MPNFARIAAGHYQGTDERTGITYVLRSAGRNGWSVARNDAPDEHLTDGLLPSLARAQDFANIQAEEDHTAAQRTADQAEGNRPARRTRTRRTQPPAVAEALETIAEVAEQAPAEEPQAEAAQEPAEAPLAEPQFTLLPTERPEGRLASVRIDRINEGTVAGAPAEFIESIRAYGVLQPIALVEDGAGRFDIAEGRRRRAAALAVGLPTIPALIFPAGTPRHVAAAITVTTNMHRQPNPISELEAIQQMVRDGASEEQIASELRLSVYVIRRRMALARLIPEFRDALLAGTLSVTTAQRVARHPEDEQRAMLAIWQETGRITREDRAAQRRARRGEQAAAAEEPEDDRAQTLGATCSHTIGELEGMAAVHGLRLLSEAEITRLSQSALPMPAANASDAEAEEVTEADRAAAARRRPQAPAVDLPDGNGWEIVLACLTAAEERMPVAPDDHTDAFQADLSGLMARVRRIAANVQPAYIEVAPVA